MPTALIIIADGSEEIETVTVIDVLRRAHIEVTAASLNGNPRIEGSRKIVIGADASLADVDEAKFDVVILPGGMGGTRHLAASAEVLKIVRDRAIRGSLLAAICAAPLVLDTAGVLPTGRYTCYPGVEKEFKAPGRLDAPIVDAGHILTSQGPGTAMVFALGIVEKLTDLPTAEKVAEGLLCTYGGLHRKSK